MALRTSAIYRLEASRLGSFAELKKNLQNAAALKNQNPATQSTPSQPQSTAKPAQPAKQETKPAQPAAPSNSQTTYTVGGDDTLWGIARKQLGDGNRWKEIYELNKDVIQNPNVIVPGMKLKLPGGASAAPQPAQPAPPKTQPATYTVGGDDTLWGIARKQLGDGNRWKEIYELNKDVIQNPNVISAGMKLKLPNGASAAPAQPAQPATKSYTVRSGDSLSRIAEVTLGDGNRWREIYDLNRDQISNPNVISAGMTLKLPGSANTNVPASTPSSGINTNRNAFYLTQPNGWTCGPTSLTMALAAWGVRGSNNGTINEMVNLTGTNSDDGVPGNASVLSNAARKVGMQAQFVSDGSPSSVRAALQRGHGVVLNGSLGSGGHFIYVAGIASDGRFIICDPARSNVTRMNDSELNHFANGYSNPRGFAEIWR